VSAELWLFGIALLVTLGFALLIRAGLDDLWLLGAAGLKRFRRRRFAWLTAQATAPRGVEKTDERKPNPLRRSPRRGSPLVIGLGAGLLLAITWVGEPLLAVWFVVWGIGAGWVVQAGRPTVRQDLRTLEVFLSTLRGVFAVGQSIITALELAAENLEEGPLQTAVAEAVRRYRADLNLGEALTALRALAWPAVTRLALVLEQIGRADEATVSQALHDLEERVRISRKLQARANTVLTVSRLTLRVLQGANLIALVAVTLLPAWHAFYATHPAGLIAATGMVLAGSGYFMAEMNRLERNAQ
jgi:hypothetical protein